MRAQTRFTLPEFSVSRVIHSEIHATKQSLGGYDIIIGRDLLRELGIVLDFNRETIIWGDGEVPMKPRDATAETHFFVDEPDGLLEEADRMSKILDAKYSKADLKQVASDTKGLNTEQAEKLEALLRRYETLFDGRRRRILRDMPHMSIDQKD